MTLEQLLALTELDRTRLPGFLETVSDFEADPVEVAPRRHPGYPAIALPAPAKTAPLDLFQVLRIRRSSRELQRKAPTRDQLSAILHHSHGALRGPHGPTPSAGGLNAIELYVASVEPGEIGTGVHHYDRAAHALVRVADASTWETWIERVPSLHEIPYAPVLWILAGDGARVSAKYGWRGARFLLQEAGHLMQNLCLTSTAAGLSTVPLGGFLEREIATDLALPPTDHVLYLGACGAPVSPGAGPVLE